MIAREQILALDDLGSAVVDVPAWGGPVRVRGMTAGEMDRFEALLIKAKQGQAACIPHAVVWCVVDDQGARIFRDDDADALASHAAMIVRPLWNAIARLSGLGEDADTGKAPPAPGASSSTSPSASGARSGSSER